MDLHLLTSIRTKGRRPLHPFPSLQAPPLQTPRECPLPTGLKTAALPVPHLLFAGGKSLKTAWLGGEADRKRQVQALVSVENGALFKET